MKKYLQTETSRKPPEVRNRVLLATGFDLPRIFLGEMLETRRGEHSTRFVDDVKGRPCLVDELQHVFRHVQRHHSSSAPQVSYKNAISVRVPVNSVSQSTTFEALIRRVNDCYPE